MSSDTDTRVSELLAEWEKRRKAGASVTPEALCEPYPALLGEVRRRIQALEWADRLLGTALAETGPEPTTASDGRPCPAGHGPLPGLPYRVVGKLGEGGMGEVYLGHDPDLDRPLAVKVLRGHKPGRSQEAQADLAERFLAEARVCGQLQHPGIVPVHGLGRLADGRPYFAMKLVKGRTLAELLAERPVPGHELPRWVQVFGQVCQALAYAHSKHVIHRDLKPGNVMVGAFGEVQVMDWGLAKVLASGGRQPFDHTMPDGGGSPPASDTVLTGDAATTDVRDGRPGGAGLATRGGWGTPAYMAPEQAAGDAERVDERSDVFGLGAILCVILTGRPPYTGAEVGTQALRGDLADAFGRLAGSGADAELVELAKRCLAAERAERPRDAGVVARAVEAYLSGVQERLAAERAERAAAEARAEEAKPTAAAAARARRRALLAAAAGLLLVLAGGAAGIWYAEQRSALRRAAARELDAAFEGLRGNRGAEVGAALGRAKAVLARGGPADLRGRLADAEGLLAWAEELDQIRQGRWAIVEGKVDYAAAVPKYAASFAARNLKVGEADPAELAARVQASPIRGALLDALDDWWALDRKGGGTAVLEVLRRADPDGFQARVREAAAARDTEALGMLAAFADVAALSQAALLGLAAALPQEEAIPLLRRAAESHRADFWCNFQLANELRSDKAGRRPKEFGEAAGHYRAALAARPDSAFALNNLGITLRDRQDLPGAERAFREAIRLNPNYARAYTHLGNVLREQRDPTRAEQACREAVRLDPKDATAHYNLGRVLKELKDLEGAEGAYREAIRIDPYLALAHNNLGNLLHERKDLAGAEKEYRAAIHSDPDEARAHSNLGKLLYARHDLTGAERAIRTAITIDPSYAGAYLSLSTTLRDQGRFREALESVRRGHDLGSRQPGWDYPSARWVKDAERLVELDGRLPAVLAGTERPESAAEAAEFARLCMHRARRHYAMSARLFADAFAADPRLAAIGKRFDAAHAATLAAGQDAAGPLPDKLVQRLRRQALDWLRADLAAFAEYLQANPSASRIVEQGMRHWQQDADLAGVRDPVALAKLPNAERAEWQKLWADVADLHARAAPELLPPPQSAPHPKP